MSRTTDKEPYPDPYMEENELQNAFFAAQNKKKKHDEAKSTAPSMTEMTEEEWTSYKIEEEKKVDLKPPSRKRKVQEALAGLSPVKRRVLTDLVKKVHETLSLRKRKTPLRSRKREALKHLEDFMDFLEDEGDGMEDKEVCPDCYGTVDECCRIVNGEPELFQCCLCNEYFEPEMEELREKLEERTAL